jgi:molecular chaperone GrpE
MSDSRIGFGALTAALNATPSASPKPAPAPSGDAGLLVVLIVIIFLLAAGVAVLLLRMRRLRDGAPAAARPAIGQWAPRVPDRTHDPAARTDEPGGRTVAPDRRRPREAPATVAGQRDVLAETCMDVADLVANNALADRLRLGLKRAGYEILAPTGGFFDPDEHQVFERRPTDDPALDRVVAATIRPGYRLDGQTVRSARVVVYGAGPRPAPRD